MKFSFKGKCAYAFFSKGSYVWEPLSFNNNKNKAKKQCAGLGVWFVGLAVLIFHDWSHEALSMILMMFLVSSPDSVIDFKGKSEEGNIW